MQKVKVSIVSYSNSLPFLYGLQQTNVKNLIDLSIDHPADCAKKLINKEVALGLIPVYAYPEVDKGQIVSSYCIGTQENVRTVSLFSYVPLNEIKTIYLDYQSRTSNQLLQLLAKEFWGINVEWKMATPGFEDTVIKGDTAALIIGDRTFRYEGKIPFQIDLAKEWYKFTGKPFVFAVWVANTSLPDSFLHSFQMALQWGSKHIKEAINHLYKYNFIGKENLYSYLTQNIDYELNTLKKESILSFYKYLGITDSLEINPNYAK